MDTNVLDWLEVTAPARPGTCSRAGKHPPQPVRTSPPFLTRTAR